MAQVDSPFGDTPIGPATAPVSPFGDTPEQPQGWGEWAGQAIGEVPEQLAQGARKSLEMLVGGAGELRDLTAEGLQYAHDNSLLNPMARPGLQRTIDWMRDKTPPAPGEWGHLPNIQEVQEKITNPAFGPATEPQTMPGRIAESVGENLIGGRKLGADILAPAIGGEVGEDIARATGANETLGRLIGGGGLAPASELSRAGALGNLSPQRAKVVKVLADAGVPITGGQATNRKALKYLEAGPFEGRAANLAGEQNQKFTAAVLKQAGIPGDIASPDVLDAARDSFGREYDAIITRTGGVRMDSQLETDILTAADQFNMLKGIQPGQRSIADHYLKRIDDAAQANGGALPADIYKTIRSDIARDMRGTTDPEIKLMLGDMQDSLLDSIGRTNPSVRGEWKDLNNRYRVFKIINKAMRGASEETNVEGNIVPAKLRGAMQQADPNFQMDQGNLAQLARSGEVLKDVPQSGTGGRNAFIAGAAGSAPLWAANRPIEATAMMASPFLHEGVGRVLASKPVRTAIIKGATTRLPMDMNPTEAAMFTLQSLQNDQPVPVEPAAPAPDEQSMNFDMPVPVDDTASLIDPRARNILRLRGLG